MGVVGDRAGQSAVRLVGSKRVGAPARPLLRGHTEWGFCAVRTKALGCPYDDEKADANGK
jgi:hypothetical protein